MQARAHLTAGREGQALEAARRAAEQCPHYAAAHYLAGKSADRLGRGEEAAEAYRRALAANESFMPPRYNLALLQLKGGDPAAAAATLAPLSAVADVRVLLLRAQARLDTADLPGAEADLRELLRLEPRHADGWALLGTVYARKNDYAEAMRAFCRGKELGSAAASANCRD
jgi:Flp pilus assembly protein TadD